MENKPIKSVKRRNTLQKQIILDTLKSLHSHVSAGTVYQKVHETHPEIGRATVYRVLSDMADDGMLLRFNIDGGNDCYDITTSPHHHIKCHRCGRVDDVMINVKAPMEAIKAIDSSGFVVEDLRIEFIGLCNNCSQYANK